MTVTAKAPCSTANLGPGFDVLGMALDAFYDTVSITRQRRGITVNGNVQRKTADKNTAGLTAKYLVRRHKIGGVFISIKKGVPAGYGLGSSAASAAAAAVAMNELFKLGLSGDELVEAAGYGERAAAGVAHYDNVAASIMGGFVVVGAGPRVITTRPPRGLGLCVGIPDTPTPANKTEWSRSVIPDTVSFHDAVANNRNALMIAAGFFKKDLDMICESMNDQIVEPARSAMIPGFYNVKRAAMRAGAAGFAISGAGPSVIAFVGPGADMTKISSAIQRGFKSAGTDSRVLTCKPARGTTIL